MQPAVFPSPKERHMHRIALAGLLCLALPSAASAEERATTREAEMMVHKAVEYLRANGKEKAFAVFSDPKGQFTYRDIYVAVIDLTGKCLAHGVDGARIGKNVMEDRDADGKLFVKERIEIAKKAGKGWADYKYKNPTSGKIEQKVSYFERVDDVLVTCGVYRP
jgi:signal transduction histidine kinase